MYQFLDTFISTLFLVLTLAIFARVLLSWLPIRQDSQFAVILFEITEPILGPLRRIVPRLGMIDLTPIVALFLLQFLERLLRTALLGIF